MQTLRDAIIVDYDARREAMAASERIYVLNDRNFFLSLLEPYLDLHIIDGAAVALDLEAGATVLDEALQEAYLARSGDVDVVLRAILTACNIIVPDEVHEGVFEDQGYGDHWLNPEVRNLSEWCESGQQYTITITRKSTLQPQVNEGE